MRHQKAISVLGMGAVIAFADVASAQARPPHIMVLFDTSGSMMWDLAGNDNLINGDGSTGLDLDTNTLYVYDGLGGRGEQSRLHIAKDVLTDAITSVGEGEVVFGLARYHQTEYPGMERCAAGYYLDETNGCAARCIRERRGRCVEWQYYYQSVSYEGDCTGGDILVPYDASDTRRDELLEYLDHYEESGRVQGFINPELRGVGSTPLGASIGRLTTYFQNELSTEPCEKFAVVLTDGDDTCSGDPVTAVEELHAAGVTVYVIAFSVGGTSVATMDSMAREGGTGYARIANNAIELQAAFAEIIQDAIRIEVCDNRDNDCDGAVDEDLYRGCSTACGDGQEQCIAGQWRGCTAPPVQAESCDGVDNNCNGEIDEDLTQDCSTNCGPGTATCQNGAWVGCTAPPEGREVCDNLDNDCDSATPDGADDPFVGTPCGRDDGACVAGTYVCVAGSYDCDWTPPTAEVCNGQDDDCDNDTDEDIVQVCWHPDCSLPAFSCTNPACQGYQDCLGFSGGAPVWSSCAGARRPVVETCNGIDDDCDGVVDDVTPLPCTQCGVTRTRACVGGRWSDLCGDAPLPEAEICDGIDNDCDGETDEGLTQSCSQNGCNGYRACTSVPFSGVEEWGPCIVDGDTEICDAMDNDCDGVIDNITRECSNACGTGTQTCVFGDWDDCSVRPVAEICDGLDSDCDGMADNGVVQACWHSLCLTGEFNCVNPECQGQQFCQAVPRSGVATWSTCNARAPTTEVCDGMDNDCDGAIDEDVPPRDCATACGTGTESCVNGVWAGCDAPAPRPEQCNGLDEDCDGVADDGLMRGCVDGSGCSGYQFCNAVEGSGVPLWTACQTSSRREVCDGVDNDCDTLVDEADNGGVLTRTCSTACGPGTQTCAAVPGSMVETWTPCDAPPASAEVCDGIDNDCDGTHDEADDGSLLTRPCTTACGAGQETCIAVRDSGIALWGSCTAPQPSTEICNNLDDDCDGLVDTADPDFVMSNRGQACGTDEGECEQGTMDCVNGRPICRDETPPQPECEPGFLQNCCDGLDNDCDGRADEEARLGERCCECCDENGSCVGPEDPSCHCDEYEYQNSACVWGRFRCIDSQSVCDGYRGPNAEVCDCMDNDCDGLVDEPEDLALNESDFGQPCGNGEGECQQGTYACRDCAMACVDDQGPSPEVCDCLDNDCDGLVDQDDPDFTSEAGERCVNGECALPCDPREEFPCPHGKYCNADHYCVTDHCREVRCTDPCTRCDSATGQCLDACLDVQCSTEGYTCHCGDCVPNTCYYVGCSDEQICRNGACAADPCRDLNCPSDQFCRDGQCVALCTTSIVCPEGRRCRDGECVDDLCAHRTCETGELCDPLTGDCTNRCSHVACAPGQWCDPSSGACADHPCLGVACPQGAHCELGTCVSTVSDDDSRAPDPERPGWIYATGSGGWFSCAVTPQPDRRSPTALVLLFLGALGVARSRRRGS